MVNIWIYYQLLLIIYNICHGRGWLLLLVSNVLLDNGTIFIKCNAQMIYIYIFDNTTE